MADFVAGYNIIKKLGDGARSQVFQVVHPETGEVFALKRVTRDTHEDTRFLDQAINEHEISIRFEHPYLRVSHELRRVRKMLKLNETQTIMEFVDGLGMDRARPNRVDKTLELFVQVADGLHHMHERGYLHTDIKPNNILLRLTGGVKIIDFGQACEIGFRKPRIQGTPDYIAPEQVNRKTLGKPTDVFNLGATLYWALTGQTYPTVITKHGKRQDVPDQADIPTPSKLNAEIPSVLSRLVMECCEYEPYRRPKDMTEVIHRLEVAQAVVMTRLDEGHDLTIEVTPHDEAEVSGGQDSMDMDDLDEALERYDYSAFDEFTKDTTGQEPDPDLGEMR